MARLTVKELGEAAEMGAEISGTNTNGVGLRQHRGMFFRLLGEVWRLRAKVVRLEREARARDLMPRESSTAMVLHSETSAPPQ